MRLQLRDLFRDPCVVALLLLRDQVLTPFRTVDALVVDESDDRHPVALADVGTRAGPCERERLSTFNVGGPLERHHVDSRHHLGAVRDSRVLSREHLEPRWLGDKLDAFLMHLLLHGRIRAGFRLLASEKPGDEDRSDDANDCENVPKLDQGAAVLFLHDAPSARGPNLCLYLA